MHFRAAMFVLKVENDQNLFVSTILVNIFVRLVGVESIFLTKQM